MRKIEIITNIIEVDDINELTVDDQQLIKSAREACDKSYAPYSGFAVGAAVRLDNGNIVSGSNQENAAYPSGLCAERTAIFWANSQYPENAIVAVAISASKENKLIENPVSPCGACRQVMLESEVRFKTSMRVIMDGSKKIIVSKNSAGLLPFSFTENDLK